MADNINMENDQQMLTPGEIASLGLYDKDSIEANFPHMADVVKGATLGVGVRTINIDAATPLVMPPIQLVVLAVPRMYSKMPDRIKLLKALIETHPTSVTGIDFGYTIETADSPIGHDSQTHKVPLRNKRSEVSPSFTYQELTGNIVWRFFNQWGWDMLSPDGNASFAHLPEEDSLPFVSSSYSMVMAAIQFDPSGIAKNIIDGAFYANMFPTDPAGTIDSNEQSIPPMHVNALLQ